MKFLILLAVVAAASAVPYWGAWNHDTFGLDGIRGLDDIRRIDEHRGINGVRGLGYGRDLVTDNIDYRTLMLGGRTHILDKDITLVKKDFIVFYYKHLVDLLDIFKTRFNDVLLDVDFREHNVLELPLYCKKMTGLMRWMMVMNIDITKHDVHYFDMFMMCKVTDQVMFMKQYWLHFNFVDVMHKDLPFMRDIFTGFGDHTGFLHKFGNFYGKKYDGVYGNRFDGIWGNKYDGVYGNRFDGIYGKHFDGIYGNRFDGLWGKHFDGVHETQVGVHKDILPYGEHYTVDKIVHKDLLHY